MTARYRCTTCGLLGTLDPGEKPDAVNPHPKPGSSEVCTGTSTVREGTKAEVEWIAASAAAKRREMLIQLGLAPDAKPLVSIPFPKAISTSVRPIAVVELEPGMLFTLFQEGVHMLRCKEKELTEDGNWKVTGVFLGPNDEEQGEPVSEVYEADDEVYTP